MEFTENIPDEEAMEFSENIVYDISDSDMDIDSMNFVDNFGGPEKLGYFLRSQVVKVPALKLTQAHIDKVSGCCICLEEFKVGEIAGNLPCKHLFHKTCLEEWTLKHPVCPFCRKRIENQRTKYF